MEQFFDFFLNFIAQFAGGRGAPENELVHFGLAAGLWVILIVLVTHNKRQNKGPYDGMLLLAFHFGFFRELIMFFVFALDIGGVISKLSMHPFFPPIEHLLTQSSIFMIAGAFLGYLLDNSKLAKLYLKISISSSVLSYLIAAFGWMQFAKNNPDVTFGQTWYDWLFHITSVILIPGFMYLIFRSIGWKRNIILLAFSFFFLENFLMLFNLGYGEVYGKIFDPIRHTFHMLAIPLLIYVYFREESEKRKKSEKSLRESEEQFRLLFERSNDAIFIVDRNTGEYLTANHAAEIMTGRSITELKELTTKELTPNGASERLAKIIRANGEKTMAMGEVNYYRKDGSIRIASLNVIPLNQKIFYGIAQDITERKQAEESLRKSEKIYKELFNGMLNGFALNQIICDEKGKPIDYRFLEVNPSFEKLTGLMSKDIIGKTAGEVLPGMESLWIEVYGKVALTGEPVYFENYHSVLNKYLEVSVFSPTSLQFAVIFSDITERKESEIAIHETNRRLEDILTELKETQKQVLIQERLRALGQLASGIAHDINNSLTPIIGYSDLLLRERDFDKIEKKQLTQIRTASLDIKQTIDRMKEFYRPKQQDEKFGFIDLNRTVLSTVDLTKQRLKDIPQSHGAVIKIDLKLQNDLPKLNANESEIREALTNIILNAADSMPDGGTLIIRSRFNDGKIVVEIQDTGIGMDEYTRIRCLDPFFSTKGEKGTGLGLSMVYGIMQRHDGYIKIYSELNVGTSVSLIFKMNKPEKNGVKKLPDEKIIPSMKILVIDDEEQVRSTIQIILQEMNHMVVISDNGENGLKVFIEEFEKGEPFDIVLTDLGMPYMDGKTVAINVKKVSPKTPVILITGWRYFIDEEGLNEVDFVLGKPITVEEINDALKAVIK